MEFDKIDHGSVRNLQNEGNVKTICLSFVEFFCNLSSDLKTGI
jgi:hypothetical protein